ncbi:unnamed protein product, partial [Discosporangium mesarthrocarpum]
QVASATTAAASAATAQRAKEHEEKSSAMFSQTEELMKFQFMSMSLSYFSSLNMLKQMRSINADTTTAAVTSSADAAAAAAAAAAASTLPSVKLKKTIEGTMDVITPELEMKKRQLREMRTAEEEHGLAKQHSFPKEVKTWSVEDVGIFLDTLCLGQYKAAFAEAQVDGEFMLALEPTDCADVLGIEHALHMKKLFLAIDKLRPLSEQDMQKKRVVEREAIADNVRGEGPPDLETVFSQTRNGRLKRLEESLDLGFAVDQEDEYGNTLLMVACQVRLALHI